MMSTPLVPPRSGRLGLLEFVDPLVRAIVAERLDVDEAILHSQVSLRDDLAVDSLDVLELVIDLEERLAVSVPESLIDRMHTIGDLVEVVAARLWERDHPRTRTDRHADAAA